MKTTLGEFFLKELEMEEAATRKCLERLPENLYNWKPHEKSMILGYLAILLADIPKWITYAIEKGEVNFATWEKYQNTTTADLVKWFDKNISETKIALKNAPDEVFDEMFVLKAGEEELMKSSRFETVSSSLNHWVHHRGQMTVYMRLNNIAVPSIYGPSADEKTF